MSSFTGGRHTPCAGCPWRVGNATRSVGQVELHDAAASTFNGTQGWHTIMACHTLPEHVDGACVGYLLSEHGPDNFAVRIGMSGYAGPPLDPDGELHSTYAAMRAELESAGRMRSVAPGRSGRPVVGDSPSGDVGRAEERTGAG